MVQRESLDFDPDGDGKLLISKTTMTLWRCNLMLLSRIVAALTLVAVVACESTDSNRNQFLTSDGKLVKIAEAVPGFGGYYGDRDTHELVIWLVDPDQQALAESQLVEAFGTGVIREAGVRIRLAQYGFDELKEWQTTLDGTVWDIPGIVSTDVADELNRVRVRVTSPAARLAVLSEMVSGGIPVEAVVIEIRGQVQAAPPA